jgi:hypothetical protein
VYRDISSGWEEEEEEEKMLISVDSIECCASDERVG